MNSITELAEHIVLDDVNDTFYRTLCYSNYLRSNFEPKTDLEQTLDNTIAQKLARQLNWSASVCSLDNATHKISHLVSLYLQGKLDVDELEKLKQDNYWLAAALDQELSPQGIKDVICDSKSGCKITPELSAVVWRYFLLQLNTPQRHLAEQVQLFSQVIVELTENENPNSSEFHHLAFLNAFPFMVLLMLLDKTIQSAKQELLNQIGFECESSRNNVMAYQPCGEVVLSFLIFDEFVKYHVHDHLYGEVESNLGAEAASELTDAQTLFLQARSKAILNSLSHIPVLTAEQKALFADQLGIQAEIKSEISQSFTGLIKKLMPNKFEYNISVPV